MRTRLASFLGKTFCHRLRPQACSTASSRGLGTWLLGGGSVGAHMCTELTGYALLHAAAVHERCT
jgi:hypothetical protein